MDSTSPITISPEHINQVLGILILGAVLAALFALDQYFSSENRKYRHIRRLLAQAKAAALPANISQDTKEQLVIAQQDFYRATKLREAKPSLPATLRQTMEYCEMQCHFVLDQVRAELKAEIKAELENKQPANPEPAQQSQQKQNRQQRQQKRRKAKHQHNRSQIYW